ncbi:MAG: VTT domain-containing protein [Acidobacteriota bacterium]|nr:VTT domain-containing protein [Acidobacteriota bacterium]
MFFPLPLALAVFTVFGWLRRLGGIGLIFLGIADNSVVPLTGSMDVLTIYLAASHHDLWPYYAIMATIGAVLGGYITYSLARKGGKETLERKFSKNRAAKIAKRFDRWGFGAVFIPALLPPPFPLVPFLVAAGGLQYSRNKFLGALLLGRGIRYSIVAGLGAYYGKPIVGFFSRHYKHALFVLIGLAVIGGVSTLIGYLRSRNKKPEESTAIPSSNPA